MLEKKKGQQGKWTLKKVNQNICTNVHPLSVGMVACTVELSYGYGSTWPFNFFVLVYKHAKLLTV